MLRTKARWKFRISKLTLGAKGELSGWAFSLWKKSPKGQSGLPGWSSQTFHGPFASRAEAKSALLEFRRGVAEAKIVVSKTAATT
jgi:hypothetical protein